jgi:glutathione S-transferase
VRIALAEKGISYETEEVDLQDRPGWLYELNASGRVPILDDAFVLPESAVIMGYLEERYPEPPLLPPEPAPRARAHLLVYRFDENLGDDYYAFRRRGELARQKRTRLRSGRASSPTSPVPWVIRARDMLGVDLPVRLEEWLTELTQRPSVAAEVDLVGTF